MERKPSKQPNRKSQPDVLDLAGQGHDYPGKPRIDELMKKCPRVMAELADGCQAQDLELKKRGESPEVLRTRQIKHTAQKVWELALSERLLAGNILYLIEHHVGMELKKDRYLNDPCAEVIQDLYCRYLSDLRAEVIRLVKEKWTKAITDYTWSLHDWAVGKGFAPEPIVTAWAMALVGEFWGDIDWVFLKAHRGDIFEYLHEGVSNYRWRDTHERNSSHALDLIDQGNLEIEDFQNVTGKHLESGQTREILKVLMRPQVRDLLGNPIYLDRECHLPQLNFPFRVEFGFSYDILQATANQALRKKLVSLYLEIKGAPLPACLMAPGLGNSLIRRRGRPVLSEEKKNRRIQLHEEGYTLKEIASIEGIQEDAVRKSLKK